MRHPPASPTRTEHLVADLARELHQVQPLPDGGVRGLAIDGREVRIEHMRGMVVDWIVLRAVICDANEMNIELVLERNARLAFSTIVLANGVYWLRVAMPVDSAELSKPARAISLAADGAKSLAPHIATNNSPAFAHYAS